MSGVTQPRPPIYLDNGATSFPKPPSVAAAVSHFLLQVGGSAGRSGHRLSQEAARVVFECREALAALLGAPDARRLAFTLNATQALNTAIYGTLRHGDRVLATSMEHNSTMRPLRDAERQA
jgi:selenocysteine lyase/cysteine desulfurase